MGESKAIPVLEQALFQHFNKAWWQLNDLDWDNSVCLNCVEKAFTVYKNHGWQKNHSVIDKNLLNSTRLILLDKLLPGAPVIKLVRHPLDVLVSNFMSHFGSNDAWHSELELIARYMLKVDEHWHRVGPHLNNPHCIIRYENIALSGHIGAELTQFLADFWPATVRLANDQNKPKFVSRTASYAQIQHPINAQSINNYKHYLQAIPDSIINIIRPIAERWNYSI